ncbi:hypothetical protein E2320_022498 [Naja naja]|nr:hypothetical protein E2320_022498 [Naja naja]
MRSSLVGLQLLLAFVLVRGTSVAEENKECCGPGVPPEKSCCPKNNSTSQEPEKVEEEPVVPAELNSEGPAKLSGKMLVPTESNSEELEERERAYRERMQKNNRSPYEAMFLKEQALAYFNKRSTDAFYRPIEDINIKVKSSAETVPCVALQKPEQKDCEPVMFWDGSEIDDTLELDHLLNFPHSHFGPSF